MLYNTELTTNTRIMKKKRKTNTAKSKLSEAIGGEKRNKKPKPAKMSPTNRPVPLSPELLCGPHLPLT